jgi:hypothetical protein
LEGDFGIGRSELEGDFGIGRSVLEGDFGIGRGIGLTAASSLSGGGAVRCTPTALMTAPRCAVRCSPTALMTAPRCSPASPLATAESLGNFMSACTGASLAFGALGGTSACTAASCTATSTTPL